MKINSNTKIILQSFLILTLFGLSVKALAVWTAPSATPPAGNIAPPVNSGGATQQKSGGLVVGFFRSMGITILDDEVTISAGDPQAGKVLTAVDSTGLVEWAEVDAGVESVNGTVNYIPRFTPDGNTLGNSVIFQDPANNRIGIGTITPGAKLDVTGGDALINGVTVGKGSGSIDTNTTVGRFALLSNTTGLQNMALGNFALRNNLIGNYNIAIGFSALYSNTSSSNVAIGDHSLRSNTSGDLNTAVGGGSGTQAVMYSNTSGDYNSAFGSSALNSNTTGNYNTALGYQAGRYLANGSSPKTTGDHGLYLGVNTKASALGLSNETAIGYNAVGSGSNSITLGSTSNQKVVFYGALAPNNDAGTAGKVLTSQGANASPTWEDASGGVSSTGTVNYIPRFSPDGNSLANSSMFQNSTNGDIGINTTTPGAKLAVKGNLNVGTAYSELAGQANGLIVEGNVGIGTSSPTQQLEITGNFKLPDTTGTAGIIYEGANPFIHGYGTNNFFAGFNTGNFTLTGHNNVGIGGASILYQLTSGIHNIGIGGSALNKVTSGNDNVAVGGSALVNLVGANGNVALGKNAGASITSGNYNTGVGYNALGAVTTNSNNTAVGYNAGPNTNLVNTVALGYNAVITSAMGSNTVLLGNSNIQKNIFYGALMPNNNAGNSGDVLTSQGTGTPIWVPPAGLPSGVNGQTLRHNGTTWLANSILVNTGANIGIAVSNPVSLFSVGSGSPFQVNSTGNLVKINNVTYSWPSAQGANGTVLTNNGSGTLTWTTAGLPNGSANDTLRYNGTNWVSSNVIQNDGVNFSFNGFIYTHNGDLAVRVFNFNTALGGKAGDSLTSGLYNTAVGHEALTSASTAPYNTAIGFRALESATAGYNAGVGSLSLDSLTSGTNNTALGHLSLNNITTGSDNTGIGHNAGPGSGDGALTNTISLGYNAQANASNKAVIGNASVTTVGGYGAWTNYSDIRLKENVFYKNDLGLDFITRLRTASYNYKEDENKKRRDGLIAQDVEKVLKELNLEFSGLVIDDDKEKTMNLSYEAFVIPLINSVQEQQKQIEELKREIEILKNR